MHEEDGAVGVVCTQGGQARKDSGGTAERGSLASEALYMFDLSDDFDTTTLAFRHRRSFLARPPVSLDIGCAFSRLLL